MKKPNVIYVFSDQHRAQACGYAGDPNVRTPNLDRLYGESVNFSMAVSGMPVCCPYRASFLTGQYPHHHGVFLNDVCLSPDIPSVAQVFLAAGYQTAYIGKWHLNGNGRRRPVPENYRHGFQYWKAMECTHEYNHSGYYCGDSSGIKYWEGYDALAQTRDVIHYVQNACEKSESCQTPFFLVMSWGPPHDPYDSAPEQFRRLYSPENMILRENVPAYQETAARRELAGYYAHISALDACLGLLIDELKRLGQWQNTIFVYTSDHGDMLHSQGVCMKQKPWEESIRVPFLLSYPERFGVLPVECETPVNSPDIMPTLLDLCGLEIPESVDGKSFAGRICTGNAKVSEANDFEPAVLLQCINPSGEWHKYKGGRPYRGIRTPRYTYVKDMHGPWLLYDNYKDPYQMQNLIETGAYDSALTNKLENILKSVMEAVGDTWLSPREALERCGYVVDFLGTNPYE